MRDAAGLKLREHVVAERNVPLQFDPRPIRGQLCRPR